MARTRAEMEDNIVPACESRRLSGESTARILAFIEEAQYVKSEKDLKRLFHRRVKRLIPHPMAVCGISAKGKPGWQILINMGFPEDRLRDVFARHLASANRRAEIQAASPAAQALNGTVAEKAWSPHHTEAMGAHGTSNVIIRGLPDIGGEYSSFFCLAQCREAMTEEHAYLMDLITPHLHRALLRTLGDKACRCRLQDSLTAREQEILHAMCAGRTNKEIAGLLGISDNTVRNHVQRIYKKLGATNRAMAVMKAREFGG